MIHLLTSKKEEYITRWLCEVDLHDCNERGIQVVRLCLLRVEDINWMSPTRDGEDGLYMCACVSVSIHMYMYVFGVH